MDHLLGVIVHSTYQGRTLKMLIVMFKSHVVVVFDHLNNKHTLHSKCHNEIGVCAKGKDPI